MCVSSYMKFLNRDGRKDFFILLKVFTWGRWGNNLAEPENPLEIP